jgi:hypothetical protein
MTLKINYQRKKIMFRLKSHAAMFAAFIVLLTTFNQTARAESWSWESILSVFSSANAVAVCTTNQVVVNNADSGAGSFRQAVIDACPGGTITFDVTGEIKLTTGQITIDKNLTIQGPSANLLMIRQNSVQRRAFQVNLGVTAIIAGLTVTGGTLQSSPTGEHGAGINNRGSLTVRDSIITGSAIFFRSGFGNDVTPKGGGIYNAESGTLTVTNSTIERNFVDGSGGGIFNDSGTVTVTKSLIETIICHRIEAAAAVFPITAAW